MPRISTPFDVAALLAWYAAHRREMPWRGHPDAYAVWVSEIMLQQTQVDTVRPFFLRFMARFPTVAALAGAPQQEVLRLWEGLGYYARARNLQRAAQTVCDSGRGALPRTAAGLAQLPGIGPYTAAAIASICFGERTPVVDGNVARVFARLLGWCDDFATLPARRRLALWLQPALDGCPNPGDLNQAMMELGALVCTPRQPTCPACPLHLHCVARRTGRQTEFPTRRRRATPPVRHAIAAVVRRGGKWLMVRRPADGLLGGLWELPGGTYEPSEALAMAAARTVRAQTGLSVVAADREIGMVTHAFSHFRLVLHVVRCTRPSGRLRDAAGAAARWVPSGDLAQLPVSTSQRRALRLADGV